MWPYITVITWPRKYCCITQIWLCVHDHDDIDIINIGTASHKECESRCHRAMMVVTVCIFSPHLLLFHGCQLYSSILHTWRHEIRQRVTSCLEYLGHIITCFDSYACYLSDPSSQFFKCLGWIIVSMWFSRGVLKKHGLFQDFPGVVLKSSIFQDAREPWSKLDIVFYI